MSSYSLTGQDRYRQATSVQDGLTGRLRRSGEFAELVDVGFEAPQESIATISVADPEVTLHVSNPQLIRIHAIVRTKSGEELDARGVLTAAIAAWEDQALARIAA